MDVKKGFQVTLDDGTIEFISLSDVYSDENNSPDQEEKRRLFIRLKNKIYGSNNKNKATKQREGFSFFLKIFTVLLIVTGDVCFLLLLLEKNSILASIGIFVFINLIAVFVIWLFKTTILNEEAES